MATANWESLLQEVVIEVNAIPDDQIAQINVKFVLAQILLVVGTLGNAAKADSQMHASKYSCIENTINSVNMLMTALKPKEHHEKSLLEHKAISGIKNLGSDKTGFRTWHEKFVNAMSQTIPGSREVFKWIVKKANEDDTENIDELSWDNQGFDQTVKEFKKYGEDLWCVLMDKCEGEAMTRIRTAKEGEGILAYGRMYKWFCLLYTSDAADE